jgi:hypothetical protein
MLRILEMSPNLALVIKYLITAGGIVILIVFKNFVVFGRIRVSRLIPVVFLIYLLLVVYEFAFYCSRVHAPEFFP